MKRVRRNWWEAGGEPPIPPEEPPIPPEEPPVPPPLDTEKPNVQMILSPSDGGTAKWISSWRNRRAP